MLSTDPNSILVVMANNTIGSWFGTVVAVDAILVLAAAVLTSYVGVGGLLKRLAMDSCLPQVLLATNKWRGTYHVIAFSFFGLCSSLFLILNGNIVELAGVYNLAFLAVMVCVLPRCLAALLPCCLVVRCIAVALVCLIFSVCLLPCFLAALLPCCLAASLPCFLATLLPRCLTASLCCLAASVCVAFPLCGCRYLSACVLSRSQYVAFFLRAAMPCCVMPIARLPA